MRISPGQPFVISASRIASRPAYDQAPTHSRIISPPPAVASTASFAVPLTYVVEARPPESGYHLQAQRRDPVLAGTDILLAVLVVGVAGQMALRPNIPTNRVRRG